MKVRGGKLITPNYMKTAMTANPATSPGGYKRVKGKRYSHNRMMDKYAFVDPEITKGLQRHNDSKLHKFFMELDGSNHIHM